MQTAEAIVAHPDSAADQPVVETASGKIRGVSTKGVHTFKGVPYGASTAGSNRFMPPRKPEPWTGVRDAFALAGRSPQFKPNAQRPELATVWGPIDELPVGEDCLKLHIWTPGLDNARRPVMVWLHGGAFSYGSSNIPRFDGTNLAGRQDVVVVAVNHRLNIFGHLHLAEIGDERFAHSGNAGVLDLIAALEWVRDNIGRFGGDAGSVTVFGQSGGGGKISTLMAMPAAKGLFHRAIIQSGATVRVAESARATHLAKAVLKELDLTPGQLDRLQQVPIEQLLAAAGPAIQTLAPVAYPLLDRYPFGPVVDGRDLPRQPFDPDAPAQSADIPLMIGDTKDEMAIMIAADDAIWNRTLSAEEMHTRVKAVAGDSAERLIERYRRLYPGYGPADLILALLTDSNFRVRTVMLADQKAAGGSAPVYFYGVDWETPVFDGRLKAPHSIDTPLVFDTTECTGATMAGPGAQALATRMSTTWATFARTGNPGIPEWQAYQPSDRNLFIFDAACRPDRIGEADPRHEWVRIAKPA